ncbi:MAG: inner membrane-spanning protein YciB [Thalassobaculum sp.]|uniref:inner membrane-spanning protein YciB n=1 Tax=Thalassobaculum sp. TaxID=2022740 RepID=UPI0032EF00C4
MTRTRALTEYGPLVLFVACNYAYDIMVATGVLIAATVAAVVWAMFKERRVPWLPVIGAVLISVFGGLTLIFEDEFFIKIKPTVASLLSAAALGVGLLMRRYLLKIMLGSMLDLDDRGWRQLTLYWMGVFLVMAAANEVAWRSLSTESWATFKLLGLGAIAVVASIGAAPIMRRAHRGG